MPTKPDATSVSAENATYTRECPLCNKVGRIGKFTSMCVWCGLPEKHFDAIESMAATITALRTANANQLAALKTAQEYLLYPPGTKLTLAEVCRQLRHAISAEG